MARLLKPSTGDNISCVACAVESSSRCSVGQTASDFGMVNIYKGLTLQLIIGNCLNAVFYLLNNKYTVFIHKISLFNSLFSSITYKRS